MCAREAAQWNVRGKRVLAIVPDHTRTAPVDMMFRVWHDVLMGEGAAMDVLIALGTHPPMNDEAINRRLGITDRDRRETYRATRFFNHRWADREQLVSLGTITADQGRSVSGVLLTDPP